MMSKEKGNENDKACPYYTLQRRAMVVDSRLFKIKDFDEKHILFTASENKCIVKTDVDLKNMVKIYEYDDYPSALDVVHLGSHNFLLAGFHKGHILVREIDSEETKQKSES
jgi:hypothetical protein